jgi:integrase
MGYQIRAYKNGRWGLLYARDRGVKAGAARWEYRIVYPEAEEFKQLGLRPEMSVEDARGAVKRGQAERRLVDLDRRRHAIAQKQTDARLATSAFLPAQVVARFESEVIPRRRLRTPHWAAARAYIVKAAVAPSRWYDEVDIFYSMFVEDRRSPDYSRRILSILNEYGWEYCKTFNQPWRDMPVFRGPWYQRIKQAYKTKVRKSGRSYECPRLRPEVLENGKSALAETQYRWLYVSLWFGLRPREANEIAEDPAVFSVSHNARLKLDVLTVYQSKVDDKPKHIPLLFPEQRQALGYLQEGKLKAPLIKTLRTHFGSGLRLYSCRKGFVNLMHERGRSITEISKWLGHENVDTTLRYYWDIQDVMLERAG